MQLMPKSQNIVATACLPEIAEGDAEGGQQVFGHVMAICPADPAYGADEGVRLAFICNEGSEMQGALVSIALDRTQMPDLRVGQYVRVYGCREALTTTLEDGVLALDVLAALDIQPA